MMRSFSRPPCVLLGLAGILLAVPAYSEIGTPGIPSPTNPPARGAVPAVSPAPISAGALPSQPPPAVVLPPQPAPPPPVASDPYYPRSYSDRMPLWLEDAWFETRDVIHDHLRIGLRYRQTQITDDSRTLENSYLGSITKLDAQQDYDPETYLTFEWLVNPYAGLRFTWEQVRAQTGTTSYDNHTDGDIDLKGPALTLMLRAPNRTRFTPSGGIGYTWLTSTFEHNPIWYNGFGGETKEADYDAWVAAGSPPWPNHGYRREIILDDTTALLLIAALEIRLTDRLDLNLFFQHMEVEEVGVTYNLSFGGNVFETTQAEFPLSNTSYGIGLRWTF